MVPSSAVIRAPIRPTSTRAVSTGPISSTTVSHNQAAQDVARHGARHLIPTLLTRHDSGERSRDDHDGERTEPP